MQSLFWFIAWLLLTFGGVTTTVAPPQPSADSAFLLNYREAAAVANGNVRVTFADLLDDSRCPADVTCAWAGEVGVAIEMQVDGQPPELIELGGMTDNRGFVEPAAAGRTPTNVATVAGYEIELLSVTPYPATAAALPQAAEYQVSLVVRTAGAN